MDALLGFSAIKVFQTLNSEGIALEGYFAAYE